MTAIGPTEPPFPQDTPHGNELLAERPQGKVMAARCSWPSKSGSASTWEGKS